MHRLHPLQFSRTLIVGGNLHGNFHQQTHQDGTTPTERKDATGFFRLPVLRIGFNVLSSHGQRSNLALISNQQRPLLIVKTCLGEIIYSEVRPSLRDCNDYLFS